jgi:hypothetical protein
VRVSNVMMTGPDVALLGLVSTSPTGRETIADDATERVYLIWTSEQDSGFALLREWLDRQNVLGIVVLLASKIIRLRCLEDLQPLTLRRSDV